MVSLRAIKDDTEPNQKLIKPVVEPEKYVFLIVFLYIKVLALAKVIAYMWNTGFSNVFSVCRGNVLFLNLLFCRSSVMMFV